MTAGPLLERVTSIVVRIAGPTRTPEPVDAGTLLGEGGFCLDSLDPFEVILACEEAFALVPESRSRAT